MTDKQLMTELGGKIPAPNSGDAPGKALTKTNGGTMWAVRDRISTGDVWIDGKRYTVRTGTEGAEGYLTITPNQILLGVKPVKLDIDGRGVAGIFLGTTQVYSNTALAWVLYDGGLLPGIDWQKNRLPRPNYTAYGDAVFNTDNMTVYIGSGATATNNAHVITKAVTPVPSSAARLNVRVQSSGEGTLNFGLLPSDAPTSYDSTKGGQLTGNTSVGGTVVTKSLTLTGAVKGAENLYTVINWRGGASSRAVIDKVWFD